MKYALINPNWTFSGSVYFGCREPHLPLEYGYAGALLEREGHEVLVVDGQMGDLSNSEIRKQVDVFRPDFTVVTTAPSYLFWRCPQPELRVPRETVSRLRGGDWLMVAVGPHGSVTPRAVLNKLKPDVVVMGEFEEVLPRLAGLAHTTPSSSAAWKEAASVCYACEEGFFIQGEAHASDMAALPALCWPADTIARHRHQHHRFDGKFTRPGAEMEASRGCPYGCSFCARSGFRDRYRKRTLSAVLEELDNLMGQGCEYVYFIDEIFMPDRELLGALGTRDVKFGIQTRIDVWEPEMLDLLGRAGCVSIEAGVESISAQGRALLNKSCRLSTDELAGLLIHARENVPFVQATLLDSRADAPAAIEEWRRYLHRFGVWTNKPVPMFPYPGSWDYFGRWGAPDDYAWERAHGHYLKNNQVFSDIQDDQPLPLQLLELGV